MVRPPPTPAAPRRVWRCTMLTFSVAAGDSRRPSAVNDQALPTVGARWQPVHAASRPISLDVPPSARPSQVAISWQSHWQSQRHGAMQHSSPSTRPMTPAARACVQKSATVVQAASLPRPAFGRQCDARGDMRCARPHSSTRRTRLLLPREPVSHTLGLS